jgi:amidase
MLSIDEYSRYDATGLAELIRAGQTTADEVHAVALEAVALADTSLNACVEGPWERPLDADPHGVFAGVPFAIKDILCHAAGVPVHMGSRALADGVVFGQDTLLMSRFRRAGLATVCTTKTPEFALNGTTEPVLGGAVRNPWDLTRSPGGSSGGSAALVASGALPVAHGNDGAGSLRIPACHTGTVGLKPSRGRVPIGPDIQEAFYANAVEFAITRSVRDAAALLDAVHGNQPGEKYSAPLPTGRYVDTLATAPRRLRIAICADSWTDAMVHPDVVSAVEWTARLLSDLGHDVGIAAPPIDWEEFLEAMTAVFCSGTAAAVASLVPDLNVEGRTDLFEATTIACALVGRSMTAVDTARIGVVFNSVSRQLASFMSEWDVLVTPVAITPPTELGAYDSNDASLTAQEYVRKIITPHPACAFYNVSGTPAISLPVAVSSSGLPIGIQFGAADFREDALLSLAAQLEEAVPWQSRLPRHHVSSLVALS